MNRNTSVARFARIVAVVVGVGFSATGEGCACDGSSAYVDNDGALQCGECDQYAYKCSSTVAACAPDDMTAAMLCDTWTTKLSCIYSAGTGGDGLDGGSDVGGDGADESSGGATACASWDPDSYVAYNRITRVYEIDQALVDDLKLDPRPLTECDSARMKMVSGGYYEFYQIGSDDLASHLGFKNGDIVTQVNGYDLLLPDDYLQALAALEDETNFSAKVLRGGRVTTIKHMVD